MLTTVDRNFIVKQGWLNKKSMYTEHKNYETETHTQPCTQAIGSAVGGRDGR